MWEDQHGDEVVTSVNPWKGLPEVQNRLVAAACSRWITLLGRCGEPPRVLCAGRVVGVSEARPCSAGKEEGSPTIERGRAGIAGRERYGSSTRDDLVGMGRTGANVLAMNEPAGLSTALQTRFAVSRRR